MANGLTFNDEVLISTWIGGKRKRYNRLFSASQHGCNAATFHTNCDNKGPTITVVYHTNGNIYGGFARVSWMPGSGESVYDADAFLFVLERELMGKACKFVVRTPEYALTMDKNCGPVFGKGPDMLVFKDTITVGTTGFTLNSVMSPGSYQWSQDTVKAITGGTFEASDVQVYAVEDVAEETLLVTPWRELDSTNWNNEMLLSLKKEVEDYWPLKNMGVAENAIQHINILLLGPVGAGKSSFFNTLNSFFLGRLSIQARAGSSDTSLTKAFNSYPIISNGKRLKLRICDCKGFEDASGVELNDIECILDGHVKNKYTFVDKMHITKENPYYKRDPQMHDRIHCVALVVDANNDPDYPMTERVHEQIKKVQDLMNQKGIPQLILMNKVDGISESVRGDLSTMFNSQEVKERVDKLANALRLPPYTVLPMKNIDHEQKISNNIYILALYNLRQMLRAADDYLLNYLEDFLDGDQLD